LSTETDFNTRSYDFVIVGGGTAGLVLAARLSEEEHISVAVIEAGEHISDMPQISIPGMAGTGIMNERIDWCFKTVSQPAVDMRQLAQPRGKVLGGSSALNLLVAGRGSASEYNAFETLGNPGWNWESFLKYFKKSETLNYPNPEFAAKYKIAWNPQYHGSNGPLQLTYPHYVWALQDPFVQTLENLNISANPEPSNGNNSGATFIAGCVDPRSMTRSYAASAYYEPISHRQNLTILTGAQHFR
jgi:choline dehydrogenase-like flavoprotein